VVYRLYSDVGRWLSFGKEFGLSGSELRAFVENERKLDAETRALERDERIRIRESYRETELAKANALRETELTKAKIESDLIALKQTDLDIAKIELDLVLVEFKAVMVLSKITVITVTVITIVTVITVTLFTVTVTVIFMFGSPNCTIIIPKNHTIA